MAPLNNKITHINFGLILWNHNWKLSGKLPKKIGKEKDAVAETIENNIRKLVTDEQAVNPKYYEKMSAILDDLVKKRKEKSIKYEQYLKEIAKLAEMVMGKEDPTSAYPPSIKGSIARKALYDNL
jgi:type I restriction enzyme R subunit